MSDKQNLSTAPAAPAPSATSEVVVDRDLIDAIVDQYHASPEGLMAILQDVQAIHHYLPRAAIDRVAERLRLPASRVYGVATFYKSFSLVPRGEHEIKVCLGTACHLRGGPRLVEALERELGISAGQTTPDLRYTLETVNCVGACALAPLVVFDKDYHGGLTPDKAKKILKPSTPAEAAPTGVPTLVPPQRPAARLESLAALEALRKELLAAHDPRAPMVVVCGGTGCLASGAEAVCAAFEAKLGTGAVALKKTGCHGFCQRGPVVLVHPAGVFYQHVKPQDVEAIVETTVLGGKPVPALLYDAPGTGEKITLAEEIPFYKHQQRIALRNNGRIDPTDIEDSITQGGYAGLARALTMTPAAIIDEVERSGLRGRGGGGFATARKWRSCVKAPGTVRYLVCNGDEGDPGAFMDRSLMEGDPHTVLEGMIIGAYAIGAHEGYIYVRLEYPLAVTNLGIAIAAARERGLLGKRILGSGFDFDIQINRGGGAFVCGESSALMASLEGKPGEPRAKYIHTVVRGFRDAPTVLNNVESWACVSDILARGADAFASVGTPGSKGTKVFSLVGKCKNNGLVEVPMGITIEDMVFKIGGGIVEDRAFKAIQTGGPSGGCIPASMKDLTIDYDELTRVGSMMGSGGLIVMDETDCMVDVARYFLKFLEEESCGKCVPCREGIRRMRDILERICAGKGKAGDVELLQELAETVQHGSLCGLGTSAPNPVLSTIRHFRHEYDEHIENHRCRAKVCKELITFTVNEHCNGCTLCARQCPQKCISGVKKGMHTIDQSKCIKCGICNDVCRFDAVTVE